MPNTSPYNVNGQIEHLSDDDAQDLHDAGVPIAPMDDDHGHDDDLDRRRAFGAAGTWIAGGRRWG